MKNKEIELILMKLKIVSEEKENGAYICDREHSKLLLSYIEQLEKDNQCKYRSRCNDIYECSYAEYQEMCNKNMEMALKLEQLENNRDKAIEYIEKHTDKIKKIVIPKIDFNYKKLLDILKGDSDENIR